MYQSLIQQIVPNKTQKYTITENGKILTYAAIINKWKSDEVFRDFYISLLATPPYPAYFWENPPVRKDTIHQPYEFILSDSPSLARVSADIHTFQNYYQQQKDLEGIVTFTNLGGDAVLVVPCPIDSNTSYPHVAAFIRNAPKTQKHALWQGVGIAMEQEIGSNSLWLSTSGLGVYWLHIRLDSRPKYYTHQPYKKDNLS